MTSSAVNAGASTDHSGAYLKGKMKMKKMMGIDWTGSAPYENLGKHSNVNAKDCYLYVYAQSIVRAYILTVCEDPFNNNLWTVWEEDFVTDMTDGTAAYTWHWMELPVAGYSYIAHYGYVSLTGKPGKAKIKGNGMGYIWDDENGEDIEYQGTSQISYKQVKLEKVPAGVINAVSYWLGV